MGILFYFYVIYLFIIPAFVFYRKDTRAADLNPKENSLPKIIYVILLIVPYLVSRIIVIFFIFFSNNSIKSSYHLDTSVIYLNTIVIDSLLWYWLRRVRKFTYDPTVLKFIWFNIAETLLIIPLTSAIAAGINLKFSEAITYLILSFVILFFIWTQLDKYKID